MATTPFIVGAYASMPSSPADRDAYYCLLAEQDWVAGLEIPYPGEVAADAAGFAPRLSPSWQFNTITAIPGTMQRLQANPLFGLASPDAVGRAEALAFVRGICDRVADLAELAGRPVIRCVELHSAPTGQANRQAFTASLTEVMGWDWNGAEIVIEHCDRYIDGQAPQKGFLPLSDEVAMATELDLGILVNWGRSCLEERDADAARQHIVAARDAGVLRGVIFSGATGEDSAYGKGWADTHPPAQSDEPVSLMGHDEIRACIEAAGEVAYVGAKICVPADATPAERLAMVRTVHDAVTG